MQFRAASETGAGPLATVPAPVLPLRAFEFSAGYLIFCDSHIKKTVNEIEKKKKILFIRLIACILRNLRLDSLVRLKFEVFCSYDRSTIFFAV